LAFEFRTILFPDPPDKILKDSKSRKAKKNPQLPDDQLLIEKPLVMVAILKSLLLVPLTNLIAFYR